MRVRKEAPNRKKPRPAAFTADRGYRLSRYAIIAITTVSA